MTNLMDAKAKVVRYGPHLADPKDDRKPWAMIIEQADGKYVALTDHEAAMARSEFETNACAKAADHFRLKLKDAENKYLDLLTGLEALAGEWVKEPLGQYDFDQGHGEGVRECGHAIRELVASASLEAKK